MTDAPKCTACAVPVHPGSVFEHDGRPFHVPCLVRSLQGEVDVLREQYETLRPHVSDRSVLRGLCRFAAAWVAERRNRDEDCNSAFDWLRQTAGFREEDI